MLEFFFNRIISTTITEVGLLKYLVILNSKLDLENAFS